MDDNSKRLEYGANLAVEAFMLLKVHDAEVQDLLEQITDPLDRACLEIEAEKLRKNIEGAATSILRRYMDEEL